MGSSKHQCARKSSQESSLTWLSKLSLGSYIKMTPQSTLFLFDSFKRVKHSFPYKIHLTLPTKSSSPHGEVLTGGSQRMGLGFGKQGSFETQIE